jgi:hypothetical protein
VFSKIIIDSPWYYFLLSIVLGFALAFWLYFYNKRHAEVSKNKRLGLFLLRFASTFLICLLLLNILFKHLQNNTQNPIVLLAIDNSSSIVATGDSIEVKKALLKNIKDFKENVGKQFTVKTILFGDKTSTNLTEPNFLEKETDMEGLFLDAENNYANQNLGAMVLVSDGIYTRGANPIYASEKLNYPVYTVAMGDTSELRDVLIQKINHNQVAYLGNNFPVEVIIQAKKYAGKAITVSLLSNGLEKAKQTLIIKGSDFISPCSFSLTADKVGLVKYTVNVTVLEGEKNKINNTQSFVLEVIDNREKILLLANFPHPDVAAIKEVIASNTAYELEYGLAQEFKKPLKAYSLVILHGCNPNQNTILADCKTNAIPVWIINPVNADYLPNVKITGALNRFNDAEPFYNATFGLFSISEELKKFLKNAPSIKTFFGNYALSNGVNSLINQRIGAIETENPLLVFTEVSGLKNAIFLGEGLWKWNLRDYVEHNNHTLFNELISKSIQYLVVKSDKSFFRINAPKIINENTAIELNAEVYNKSYELSTEPEVSLVLKNKENKKFNYNFGKTANAYQLNLGVLPWGEYTYEATTKINSEVLVKKGIIMVKEVIAEKINTVANHQLLYQLANRSKGKMFYPNQFEALQQELLKNEQLKPITYTQTSTSLLIDLKWLFFFISVLLATEWFLRKRFFTI